MLQGLDPPLEDAPWPSGFGPPGQQEAPTAKPRPVAAAEVDVVAAEMLPGGTVRPSELLILAADKLLSLKNTSAAKGLMLRPVAAAEVDIVAAKVLPGGTVNVS